jgi:hypothetical protein
MPIKIKNIEWIQFRNNILNMIELLNDEQIKIDIPKSHDNFELYVNDCEVHPVFVKKPEYFKIEYDFSLCDIKIRTLSLYLYNNVLRFDFSLKDTIV